MKNGKLVIEMEMRNNDLSIETKINDFNKLEVIGMLQSMQHGIMQKTYQLEIEYENKKMNQPEKITLHREMKNFD